MTFLVKIVSDEMIKVKMDREIDRAHNLCCLKAKGYENRPSITEHFISSSPFFGTFF